MSSMFIESYLRRLGLEAEAIEEVSPKEALNVMVKQHYQNISFENIDMILGKQLTLDIDQLFQKIIIEKKGGSCLELNTLFCKLLSHLGFQTYQLLCDVFFAKTWIAGHCISIVKIEDNSYLVDVGNAIPQSVVQPLLLRDGFENHCSNGIYKTFVENGMWKVMKHLPDEGYTNCMKWPINSMATKEELEDCFHRIQTPNITHIPDILNEIQVTRKLDEGRRCLSLHMGRLNVHHCHTDGSYRKELIEDIEDVERYVEVLLQKFDLPKEAWTQQDLHQLAQQLKKHTTIDEEF